MATAAIGGNRLGINWRHPACLGGSKAGRESSAAAALASRNYHEMALRGRVWRQKAKAARSGGISIWQQPAAAT